MDVMRAVLDGIAIAAIFNGSVVAVALIGSEIFF